MKNPFGKLKERLIPEDREQPFLEHLEAFRQMLFQCLISVGVMTLICIPFAKPILAWVKAPLLKAVGTRGGEFELITTSPVEGIVQIIKIIFTSGVLLSLPMMILFVARFVLPGLKEQERKVLFLGGLLGTILFAAGVVLCYFISLPVAIKIMLRANETLGTVANWKIEKYLGFVMHLLIGFGLALELPLILIMLGRMGLVSVQQLRKYRRHVFIGILVLSMLLTPPDVITQLQMSIPLYLLYECCIFILNLFDRRKTEVEGTEV